MPFDLIAVCEKSCVHSKCTPLPPLCAQMSTMSMKASRGIYPSYLTWTALFCYACPIIKHVMAFVQSYYSHCREPPELRMLCLAPVRSIQKQFFPRHCNGAYTPSFSHLGMNTSEPADLLDFTPMAILLSFSHWDGHLGLDPVDRDSLTSCPLESTHQHSEPWHWISWYWPSSVHWGTYRDEGVAAESQMSFWNTAWKIVPSWVLSSALSKVIVCCSVVKNCSFSSIVPISLIKSLLRLRFTERPYESEIFWSRLKLTESSEKNMASCSRSSPFWIKPTWLKTWLNLKVPLAPTVPVKLKLPIFFKIFPPKRFSWSLFGFVVRDRAFKARAPVGNNPWTISARMSPTSKCSDSGKDLERPDLARSSWNSRLHGTGGEKVFWEAENTLFWLKYPVGP